MTLSTGGAASSPNDGHDGGSAAAFGVWDGADFVVWGAQRMAPPSPMARAGSSIGRSRRAAPGVPIAANAAFARAAHYRDSGWTARVLEGQTLFMGGSGASGYATDGALYDAASDSWASVPAWPSGAFHMFGFGVWSGDELVVWGGRPAPGDAATEAGERFRR